MRKLWLLLFLTLSGPAFAQAPMGERAVMSARIASHEARLTISGKDVTLTLQDAVGSPIDTTGMSGMALIVAGATRKNLKLRPDGRGTFSAGALTPIGQDAIVTVTLRMADGTVARARFEMPSK